MKTNTIILSLTIGFVVLTSLITCSNYQIKFLKNQSINQNLLSHNTHYEDIGLSLNGKSLVLYNVTHPQYTPFEVRRVLITNTLSTFLLKLQGIHGSLMSYFSKHTPFSITEKILDYDPSHNLLNQPLITFATLGYDTLDGDIIIAAEKTEHNQIICTITFQENGQTKARFESKPKAFPQQRQLSEILMTQSIPMYIKYLDSEIKKKLDTYTLSKGITTQWQELPIPFSLLQK